MEVIRNKVKEGTNENRLNDAERTLIREAEARGAKIVSLGATRPMCSHCQKAADDKGIGDRVATPKK